MPVMQPEIGDEVMKMLDKLLGIFGIQRRIYVSCPLRRR